MLKSYLVDSDEVIKNLENLSMRFGEKKVLLTGAAGFLGAQYMHFFFRLNQVLLAKTPCKVFAFDNFSRGIPQWMDQFQNCKEIILKHVDITKNNQLEPAHFIIHAASIASPIFYRKHPIETMDANVVGLRHLLDHAVKHPPESFLFYSSSEIYGDPDPKNIPTGEDYRGYVSCTGPRACYDESKRYGETLCVNFQKIRKVPVKIVRPFNNYGPGLKITDRRVLPDFFRDAMSGKNIVLHSDGKATRTFCYVSDALTGYLQALLSHHDGEAFNIGADEPEISMKDLAEMVIQITGANVKVERKLSDDPNYLTDNPQRRCPNLAKSRQLLGYNPKVSLTEGLTRMFKFYKESPEGNEG